jgi:nucleotide-binding universal stress UspA family protein
MKPVLLATDGSPTAEKATATAIDLARLLDTELVIVSVWDVAYAGYSAMGFAPTPMHGDLARLGEKEVREVIAEAAARAEEAGVETRSVVLRGIPVEAICEAAERFAPQFLVVGSHGWGALKRALFGSVSAGVLHHATCPVLVVPGVSEQVLAVAAENGARETAHVSN